MLLFIAPYIKEASMRRLVEVLPSTVSEFTCITRWLPQDIASGVCDITIFDIVARIPGGRMFIHPLLHAKYYSNGSQTLIGSANLTSRGLEWYRPSNIELLLPFESNSLGLLEWETALLDSCIEVNNQIKEEILRQVSTLQATGKTNDIPEIEVNSDYHYPDQWWVPRCPVPDRLWDVYRGGGTETIVVSAFDAAKSDLKYLSLPIGISNNLLFNSYVASVMKQTPLISELDKLSEEGLSDSKAYELLSQHVVDKDQSLDYTSLWTITKRWLTCFLPDMYRVESDQKF